MARLTWPPRGMEVTGFAALRDLSLTLIFWLLFLMIALELGKKILGIVKVALNNRVEAVSISFALGTGFQGFVLLLLGLFGLLSTRSVAIVYIGYVFLLAPGIVDGIRKLPVEFLGVRRKFEHASWNSKLAVFILLGIGILSFLNSLLPPSDYDGLMYHLVAPVRFLEAGGIVPDYENWYNNGPLIMEFVFIYGLAFGDDVLPQLIHFSTGVALVAATWATARRWGSRQEAWLSAVLLVGIPTLPILASSAYIDLGWALFEFLGTATFLIWLDRRSTRWLILSSILLGFGLSSKYPGLIGFGIIGLFVLISLRKETKETISKSIVSFVVPAALIGAPWYMKNLIWFGNPLYPLYIGGPAWGRERLALLQAYISSFGVGKRLVDFMLLPVNMFIYNSRFSAVLSGIDIPNPLYLLLPLYLFVPRRRVMDVLALLSITRFVVWSIGSQQTRFLMPVFPILSILIAYTLMHLPLPRRFTWTFQQFFRLLAIGLLLIPFFYLALMTSQRSIGTIVGLESKERYLSAQVSTYPHLSFAKAHLDSTEGILQFADGRSYYCPANCISAPDQFRWAGEIDELSTGGDLRDWFESRDIGYLLLGWEEINFLLNHDPTHSMRNALIRLFEWKDEGCLENIYQNEKGEFYKITC